MEKYKFLISKNSTQIRIFNCYSCETVWVKVLLSKGWMVAVRNYSTNTIMEKNKQGEGGGLRIQNLVLIPLGHFELHFWLCQPQTRKTTVV